MLIIPEIKTVLILVPRTGSGSLKRAVLARYPNAMLLYRHMEADGVPAGYDRWRRIGVCRHPVERLWSLYKFISTLRGAHDSVSGSHDQAYVDRLRASVQMPFNEWVLNNQLPFTSPYDSADGGRFWPQFTVRHALPENRKSQFVYLRPDIGTLVYEFSQLGELATALGVTLPHVNKTGGGKTPKISAEAARHIGSVCRWEIEKIGYAINTKSEVRAA